MRVQFVNTTVYDLSMLYTTLLYGLIKEKLTDLIERTCQKEDSHYPACNDRNAFFTADDHKRFKVWSCQNVCDTLSYFLDNISIRFEAKLHT